MVILDEYDRKARLIPGLVTVVPFAVVVASLGWKQQPVVASVIGLLSVLGGPLILVNAVRARGLAIQEELFARWGGAPTTQAVRWRGAEPWSAAERRTWRAAVSKATGMTLPSEASERADEGAADGRYKAAVTQLRNLTRDKNRFPLVFMENRNFGYERNLLGMRPSGIGLSVVGCVALLGLGIATWSHKLHGFAPLSLGIGSGVCLLIVAFWLMVPRPSAALLVGRRYAERLMDAAVELARD